MGDVVPTRSFRETSDLGFGLDTTTNNAPHATVSIGMLNGDALLIIFDFCRLAAEEKFEDVSAGIWSLNRSRWWHKLTQICQRWRSLILASPSRLHLHIVCTKGTPVEEMLAHFPHLPLEVDYMFLRGGKQPDDERNILLSLQRRHHVRSIRLEAPDPVVQKVIIPLDEEFPLLDRLSIMSESPCAFESTVTLPKSLRAPNLRHLILDNVDLQIGTPILTTLIQLVSLTLRITTSTPIPPEYLADLLVHMPQLRAVSVCFGVSLGSLIPHSGVGTYPLGPLQAPEAPKMFFTLRCLERLWFTGASIYLECILSRIIAPVLNKFDVYFFDQGNAIPNLSRFLDATAELSFRVALINVKMDCVTIDSGDVRPHRGSIDNKLPFYLRAEVDPPSWHVASASQICSAIGPVFSVTEELILCGYHKYERWSETRGNDNCINWRTIFRQFSNIKTLEVPMELVEELSLSLEPDGEGDLGLLPKLLQIVVSRDVWHEFDAFIDSRRIAGRPVNLVHTRWQ